MGMERTKEPETKSQAPWWWWASAVAIGATLGVAICQML